MTDRLVPVRRALLSVWDKTGVVELARDLADRGVELLSTGGTMRALREAGLPVTAVSDFTGHPEVFSGRVKTLHPRLEGAILFRRDDQSDEAAALDIPPIDLVVVNLYPFEAVSADPACDLDRAMEHVDIGGPTMVRAAAKNHASVAVVTGPEAYGELRVELEDHDGATRARVRRRWAQRAFARVSAYDAAISSWLQRVACDEIWAPRITLPMSLVQTLRYGENPHQAAAFYGELGWTGPTIAAARQHQGKGLSYNNIMDADAALQMVLDLDGPAAVLVKHSNPCGAAVAPDPVQAWDDALACDPLSAFGGILAINRPFSAALAQRIGRHFLEVILAPSYEPDGLEAMARKKNLRLLEVPGMDGRGGGERMVKRVMGGYLLSGWDVDGHEERRVVTARAPTEEEKASLEFAWRICKHVKSNAILLARGTRTVGVGAGQMSRVDAAEIAILKASKAGLDTAGSALASDAFFPFRDGLDAAAAAGCTAVIQPGGSKRDAEVIAAADEHGIAMVFTGTRHFRHG